MTHHVLLYPMVSCICPSCIYGAMLGRDVPYGLIPPSRHVPFYRCVSHSIHLRGTMQAEVQDLLYFTLIFFVGGCA